MSKSVVMTSLEEAEAAVAAAVVALQEVRQIAEGAGINLIHRPGVVLLSQVRRQRDAERAEEERAAQAAERDEAADAYALERVRQAVEAGRVSIGTIAGELLDAALTGKQATSPLQPA